MTGSMLLLVPLLVLPIVVLFAFAGCDKVFGIDYVPPPLPYDDSIIGETGLLSYWRLDDQGNEALDSAPDMPQNGTYSASAARAQPGVLQSLGDDPNDLATDFDGSSASVDVPSSMLVNPMQGFSLEAWIKPDLSVLSPGVLYIVAGSFEYAPPTLTGFALGIVAPTNPQNVPQPPEATAFVLAGETGGANINVLLDPNAGDGWYHLVMTYSKTGAGPSLSSSFVLHVNGSDRSFELPTTTDYFPVPMGSASPFRIGGPSVPAPNMAFFKGAVDEVALYNVPLTASQVKAHFDAAK